MLRIESSYLRCSQGLDVVRTVYVGKGAVPVGVHGDSSIHQIREGVSPSVVVEKEKQLVLQDGTADISTELVPNEWRPRDARVVVEPIVGLQRSVAMVFDESAVE